MSFYTKWCRFLHYSMVCPCSLWKEHRHFWSYLNGSILIGSSNINLGSSWISGMSYSKVMVSMVSLRGCYYRPFCFRPPCLDWLFRGFELVALLFFVGWFVTKTYWEAARTSSLSIAYLSVRLNKSSIKTGGFLVKDSKNKVLGLMLHLKIWRMASML